MIMRYDVHLALPLIDILIFRVGSKSISMGRYFIPECLYLV